MKTLGVIGGLGPMATAYFLQLATQMTDAAADQEHMEILLCSKPAIPDRTKYILGESKDSPLPEMISAGRKLREMGAGTIAIPCITAHYFHKELEEQIGIPIIHAIEETISCLQEAGAERVGILATDGTIRSNLFQQAFAAHKIQGIVPGEESQRDIMRIIYDEVKAGRRVDMKAFYWAAEELSARGAQVILLGCTELSLIKKDNALPSGYLDVLEVLARKAVQRCARVRKEYARLITE